MKKYFKIVSIVFMVMIMCLSSITIVKGYNDHFTTYTSFGYKGVKRKSYTSNVGRKVSAKGHTTCFYNDGTWLYCIENGQTLTHDASFDKVDDIESFLESTIHKKTTAAQKQKWLSVLMTKAPADFNGTAASQSEETHIRYCVISTLIWEIMDECRDKDFQYIGADAGKTAPRDGNTYATDEVRNKFFKYYDEYVSEIEDFYKIPSFTSSSIVDAPIYEMNYNQQTKQYVVSLKDTQGVLNNYDISAENCTFKKDGNTLQITTNQKIENGQNIVVYLKDNQNHRQSGLVGFQPSIASYQKIMCAGELVPIQTRAYLKLKVKLGSLELKKTDAYHSLVDGAIFHLTNHQDVNMDMTVSQGKLTIDNLKPGLYELYEVKAPQGYLLNTQKYQVKIEGGKVTQQTIVNQEPLGQIQLKKTIDASITSNLLGDAYVKNISYGLYAKEDIKSVASSHTYYTKDQCVGIGKTDSQGLITWKDLPLGKYFIKELETNPSLLLNSSIIDVELKYANMNETLISVSTSAQDKIASRRIQIFKEGTKDGQGGVVQGLKGAEFTFVLNSDFEKVGFEKATKYFTGVTNDDGFLTTSFLPYGTYRVRETKTPDGYYGTSDFLVMIDQDYSFYEIPYQIKKLTVNNVPFETLLKIVKKDKETGKTVQIKGATFKIKNLDTQEYVSYTDWSAFPNIHVDEWSTHEDGTITLNTKLKKGRYALEEIKAPQGYLLNKQNLIFEIDNKDYDISNDGVTPIVVVEFFDEVVKGEISIHKMGDVLTDYKDGQFIYEKQELKDVTFGIYAYEDILSASDQSLLYKKGEKVCEVITDENGRAKTPLLPLGKYECKELKTNDGYILNAEPVIVTLDYQGENKGVVEQKIDFINEREKITVQVGKKDEDSKEFINGAELSLIANQDIYNDKGEKIVEANTVLKTIQSSKDGYISFDMDLPLQAKDIIEPLYRIEETKQPDGYVKTNVVHYVQANYSNKDMTYQFDFFNKITLTHIWKLDSETNKPLSGALLQIIDPITYQVIDEWESSQDAHIVKGLIMDKEYILHEVKAPDGYMETEDLLFVMNYPEKTIQLTNEKVVMETLADEPPVTEDSISLRPLLTLLTISFVAIIVLNKKKVS